MTYLCGLHRYYPTIFTKDGNTVEFICEFTVKDYVDEEELNWWEELAHNIDRPFYLFISLNMVEEIYNALRKRKMKRFINHWVWFKDGKKIKLLKYRR